MFLAIALHEPGVHLHNIWNGLVVVVVCGIMAFLIGQFESLSVFAGGALIFSLLALIYAVVQFFSIF